MPEFLVHFKITIPPGTDPVQVANLYTAEAAAAEPLIKSGHFRRVWREAGTRNHWALWAAPDANFVHECYSSFPLWQAGYAVAEVIALADNENDPGWPGPEPAEVTVASGEPTAHLRPPLVQTLAERERQLQGERGKASRYDNQGTDRRLYEDPSCGSYRPHDAHMYSPMGSLTVNCCGSS